MTRLASARFLVLCAALLFPACGAEEPAGDPFLWLEEVEGEKALAWVEQQNAEVHAELARHPAFAQIESDTLAVLEADDRLVVGRRHGDWMYDFWRDAAHPRGVYRRATVASYLAGEPAWDVVLDLDAVAEAEGRNWVWKGMALRRPDYQRGLLRLSDGGSDAVVVREFDIASKRFVDGGFELPEAKGGLGWIDADTVFVETDFGPGTLTDSGYPRIVKRWRRGTPLAEAETIFEGPAESVSVGAYRAHYGDLDLDWVTHDTSFYTADRYLLEGDTKTPIDIPDTASVHDVFENQVLVQLYDERTFGGTTYSSGTVLSTPLADLKAGKPTWTVFFAPTEATSLSYVTRTKSYVLAVVMEDVRDHLYRYHRKSGAWVREEVEFSGHGTKWLANTDVDRDTFMVSYSSFLRPRTLFHVDARTLEKTVIAREPARFDPAPYASQQLFATSKDGTRVPYFLVGPKELPKNGKHPTLLRGYGGFRIAQRPRYLGARGRNWLDRGGVYVVANIRGGGEYGPRWHDAALKEKRHKAFEDFEAVAEDLISRKITSPQHLGIQGGSNGGLLVGACFTRRPELFGAVVCQVPLLDMRRYNKLLAGASWMAEYGNPDIPDEWAFLRTYSPYHNLSADATYPSVLFTTSTKDDRVHPGHARKMVARMRSMGHPVLYYENTEGGHAGAANSKQRAHATALVTTYLLTELGPSAP